MSWESRLYIESRRWRRRSCKQLSAFVTVRKNFLPKSYLRTERGSTQAYAQLHIIRNGMDNSALLSCVRNLTKNFAEVDASLASTIINERQRDE